MKSRLGIFAIAAELLFACAGYASGAPTTKTELPCTTVVEKAYEVQLTVANMVVYKVDVPATENVFAYGFYLDLCARVALKPDNIPFTPQNKPTRYMRPASDSKQALCNINQPYLIKYCHRQKIVV